MSFFLEKSSSIIDWQYLKIERRTSLHCNPTRARLLLLMHKAINLSLLSNKQLSPMCIDRLIESLTILRLTEAMFDKVIC